jgi:hypothetical protein
MKKKGDDLLTSFGQGALIENRPDDEVSVVPLPYATLYANTNSISAPQQSHEQDDVENDYAQAMELNVVYEALEQMRQLNLQVECQQRGIACNDSQCTACLLSLSKNKSRFPRIQKLVDQHVSTKICSNCLSCGSPVCSNHASQQFRKESIPVCQSCEKIFTLDFVVECMIATDQNRKQHIDHLVNVYDRILLLLRYSDQYIPQVSRQLEKSTVVQNKVGIGSSSAGIVSGVLGMAAAATILTPAGPPLLIASLLFGGTATTIQTGTEVKNYFSDSNQLADRVLALHGMLKSILKVTSTLRDALLRDYLRTDGVDDSLLKQHDHEIDLEKHKGTLLAGLTVSRAGAASVELGALATAAEVGAASRSARFFTRGGTQIMRTARFARFAGGALSAATLLFETKCMSDTIQSIRAGNPCEKARLLEEIQVELPNLPSTKRLDSELQNYLEGFAQRERRMTEEECVRLILDASRFQDYPEDEDGSIVFVESGDSEASSFPSYDHDDVQSTASAASLLERIERFKKKDSDEFVEITSPYPSPNNASLIERISMYKKRETNTGSAGSHRLDDRPESVPIATL